jgi:ABC-type amino acid transport system permease subunit
MNTQISINGLNLDTMFNWIFGFIWVFIWLVFSIVFSFIVAQIARNKGYSFGGFFIFGVFAFIPALIVILLLPAKSQPAPSEPQTADVNIVVSQPEPPRPKQCQYCASLNPPDAYKCQHCGAPLQ